MCVLQLYVFRTFDDQSDDVGDLTDRVDECTRVGAAVSAFQTSQLHPVAGESNAVAWNYLAAVLPPEQFRSWRRRGVAEQVDGVADFLD